MSDQEKLRAGVVREVENVVAGDDLEVMRGVVAREGWGKMRGMSARKLKKRLEGRVGVLERGAPGGAVGEHIRMLVEMARCAPSWKDIYKCLNEIAKLRGLHVDRRKVEVAGGDMSRQEVIMRLVEKGWVKGAEVVDGEVVEGSGA
jgi:hypothetical protein